MAKPKEGRTVLVAAPLRDTLEQAQRRVHAAESELALALHVAAAALGIDLEKEHIVGWENEPPALRVEARS